MKPTQKDRYTMTLNIAQCSEICSRKSTSFFY